MSMFLEITFASFIRMKSIGIIDNLPSILFSLKKYGKCSLITKKFNMNLEIQHSWNIKSYSIFSADIPENSTQENYLFEIVQETFKYRKL